jgi:hypothetical protein
MTIPSILAPVFVLVLLTFVLLFGTGRTRIAALKTRQVRVEDIALGQSAWPNSPTQFGRAYINQFELPTLFYVLVILALITRKADNLFFIMEWIFVVLRLAHALVHVTTNRMSLRFWLFAAGAATLVAMWVIFAIRIMVPI